MAYMLQIGGSTIHRIYGVGSFYENNIPGLNLRVDDGFLHYSIFNKTCYGLTDIIIGWDQFKPVLHPEFF